jgi:hypothetical protein
MPLRFDRTPPDTRLTVPAAFVRCDRILDGRPGQPTLVSTSGVDMRLRFQLPPAVLPFRAEYARLTVTIAAPGRRFTVASDGVQLLSVDGPAGEYRVDLDRPELLRLDDGGGLHLTVAVGDIRGRDGWTIEVIGLDVTGRTVAAE